MKEVITVLGEEIAGGLGPVWRAGRALFGSLEAPWLRSWCLMSQTVVGNSVQE